MITKAKNNGEELVDLLFENVIGPILKLIMNGDKVENTFEVEKKKVELKCYSCEKNFKTKGGKERHEEKTHNIKKC